MLITVKDAEARKVPRWKLALQAQKGEVVRVARGVYASGENLISETAEMEILAKYGAKFVVTLESALRFHGFTTVLPRQLSVAMKRGARMPKVPFPLHVVRVSDEALAYGVVEHELHGVMVPIYTPAKSVADVFKFRNQVGLDLALEAMKEGLKGRFFTVDELTRAADVDRVQRIMLPYLEGYLA